MTIEVVQLGGTGVVDRLRRGAFVALATTATRPFLAGPLPVPVRRVAMGLQAAASSRVPRDVGEDDDELGGVPARRLAPQGAAPDRALLFLHGGGYYYGDRRTHGPAAGALARRLGVTAWLPRYRLVPEHPNTAPLQDALAAYRALLDRVPARGIVLSGDSAGGGLALSLACAIRDEGLPLPAAVSLHSPWVDATPESLDLRRSDAILRRQALGRDRERWVGEDDPRLPHLSPLYGNLADLPPVLVQWGQREGLHMDAERLVVALGRAGVDVTGEAYPGLWHDAFLHVPALPEANQWLDRTAAFLLGRLG